MHRQEFLSCNKIIYTEYCLELLHILSGFVLNCCSYYQMRFTVREAIEMRIMIHL